jgi:streptogrisin C
MNRFRAWGCRAAVWLAVSLAVPATAQVAPPPHVQTPAEALTQDAAEYARQFGVPQLEAERRLRALTDSVGATDSIEVAYRDRLAGISIEHRPALRILVYLTGDAAVPERRLSAGGMSVPIVFRTGAKATRDRVIWAMTWHQGAIRAALPNPPAMGLDPRTGELVVIVPTATAAADGSEAIRAKLEAIAGVPVRLRVLDQVDVNLSAEGGSRVEGVSPADGKRYLCTTAFTVTDGARYGVATAAHCLDDLSHIDPQRVASPLAYVGQWGWGYQDVQINASPEPLAGLFYADTAKTIERPVTGQRTRDSTRAGDFVCHRGETTGYSCALVDLTDFAPGGDLCGGACLPTWVTVAGPTCKGGDSGSPVFIGTTAMGIVKGATYRDGRCMFYFYMSIDYLPKGWSLVRGDLPTPVAPPVIGAKTMQ